MVIDRPLRQYQPRRRNLALIGTDDRHAVASWCHLGWQGAWGWRWKTWIDHRFIKKYNDL
jgi:selenide,water dikinase